MEMRKSGIYSTFLNIRIVAPRNAANTGPITDGGRAGVNCDAVGGKLYQSQINTNVFSMRKIPLRLEDLHGGSAAIFGRNIH